VASCAYVARSRWYGWGIGGVGPDRCKASESPTRTLARVSSLTSLASLASLTLYPLGIDIL